MKFVQKHIHGTHFDFADINVKSSAGLVTGTFTAQDYFAVLKVIFQNVAAVHSADELHHTPCLNNSSFLMVRNAQVLWLLGMPRGATLSVYILSHHSQNNFVMNVMYCLRKQMIHIFSVIVSLSRNSGYG
jgi:hypothetical protein